MAQAAGLSPPAQAPRLSQLLPTVKCSNCSQPVPLADLADHVCPPQPPLPPLQRLPTSSNPPSSFLPQRLQSMVSARANTPPRGQESRSPQPDSSQRLASAVYASRKDSLPSTTTPPSTAVPHRGNSLTFQDRPSTQSPPVGPVRNAAPTIERIKAASKVHFELKSPPRMNDAVNSGDVHNTKSVGARLRRPSLTGKESPAPRQQPPVPSSTGRNNLQSNSSLPPSLQPRGPGRTPSASSSVAHRGAMDRSQPSFDQLHRPNVDTSRPSLDHQRPPPDRNVMLALTSHAGPASSSQKPPAASTVPFPTSTHAHSTTRSPVMQPPSSPLMPPPRSPVPENERDIDTKCGGEAGMAGVGRRGFAAVARAAMLAASLPGPYQPQPLISPHESRSNAPKFLNINPTVPHVTHVPVTPPFSPNSVYGSSPVSPLPSSPISPAIPTPTSARYPSYPSPTFEVDNVTPKQSVCTLSSPNDVRVASPSRTPSPPIPNPFERRLSGETVSQSPMMNGFNMHLPLLDMLKQDDGGANESDDESVYTTNTSDTKGAAVDSETGLAYADESDEDTPVVMPLNLRKSNANIDTNKVRFPTMPSPGRNQSSGPVRKESTASTSSAGSAHSTAVGSRTRCNSSATQSTARSGGALERAMETLIEEGASISVLASGSVLASIAGPSTCRGGSGKPNRSNTVPGPASPENKAPKLPARSHTNPSLPHVHLERVKATGKVARIRNGNAEENHICVRCKTKIEDGRWIQMDEGSVLCERCWKNMYLPKCRRCNLPIEKQAVSSRDGQLKGKYHRGCFNCHACHQPFPDKEFYVFDGKPFCAYHYHEANDSLCAAASCGQPIEGPCAVNHAGRRYHPEHLLCEYEDWLWGETGGVLGDRWSNALRTPCWRFVQSR
ncbi:hypothetical protein F5J12DRAFT_381505 [Pisolithus orientalis]|uniref:uncharacterized protein n=1 Tax=Pisolithus orientalis TaxID=936130 RepID=UPI002224119B|nr:uncharacterized protein F5J12DRAFT_381505 [Pisolithus orientalis]KAI6028469.1 hypothetical protein F5J12DRAFT_381505 [Pisolithus orientalis]